MKRQRPPRRLEGGFTLVELAVAMSLAGILLGLAVGAVGQNMLNVRKVQGHVGVVTDVQYAMDRMSKDIRTADPLVEAKADTLTATIWRGGACRLVTYAVTASADPVSGGYLATGRAFTVKSRACGSATPGTPQVLIRAVPAGSQVFSYFAEGASSPLALSASGAATTSVARVRVTLAGSFLDTSAPNAITTDINLRNARS